MKDLADIRQQLEHELQQIASRADKIDNRLRQPGDEDWEEQATQRENDEVLESLGKQAVQEMEQIKQALHRIREGTYGICTKCGNEIPAERMGIMRYATTCTACV